MSEPVKYSGNPILNSNALIFAGFFIGMVFIAWNIRTIHSERIPILFIPTAIFYLALGWQLHYYTISNAQLIIQNHFWLWKKQCYDLNEIREAVIESPYNVSYSLRIITKNFKSKLYPGGSLRNKDWKQLKQFFEEQGITVRDEIGLS